MLIVFIFTLAYGMVTSSHYAFSGALVQQNGLTKEEAGYLLSLSGITDIMGNFVLGSLFDLHHVKRKSTMYFCVLNLFLSVCALIIPFLNSFASLCIAFGLWGVFGTVNTTKNILLSDNLIKEQFVDAVGITLVAMAIGNAAGPFLTGNFERFYLKDGFNEEYIVFI